MIREEVWGLSSWEGTTKPFHGITAGMHHVVKELLKITSNIPYELLSFRLFTHELQF